MCTARFQLVYLSPEALRTEKLFKQAARATRMIHDGDVIVIAYHAGTKTWHKLPDVFFPQQNTAGLRDYIYAWQQVRNCGTIASYTGWRDRLRDSSARVAFVGCKILWLACKSRNLSRNFYCHNVRYITCPAQPRVCVIYSRFSI